MRDVPQIRAQNAYNCGLYSLWMALESLSGVDNALIKKIEDKGVRHSDSMGGIFNYLTIERIVESLGYRARRVHFHDRLSFVNYLNVHANDAILIAYSFDARGGQQLEADSAANSAHWRVAERFGGDFLRLANPHGVRNWVKISDIVSANLQLKEGNFNWRKFVDDSKDDDLFKRQAKLYKNNPEELRKRGREKIHLGGYFIALSIA